MTAQWPTPRPMGGPLPTTARRGFGRSSLARRLLLPGDMVVALVQVRLQTAAVVGAGPPAAALWQRLRRSFPWTVAATLRARGVTWLGRTPSVDVARRSMERVWSPLRRRLGWPAFDIDVREVMAARVGAVARRVHGLPSDCDALSPEVAVAGWSTARDLLGGVADPWVRPRTYRELTWGAGGCWHSLPIPEVGLERAWLEPVRAALRAPWLHATAPTVAGLLRGVRARARGDREVSVPQAWVDAALRCALDPHLRGFPQPRLPPERALRPTPLRPWAPASAQRSR